MLTLFKVLKNFVEKNKKPSKVLSDDNYTLYALAYMVENQVLFCQSLQHALSNGMIKDFQSFIGFYEIKSNVGAFPKQT
jgi:hypothetical protein